MIEKEIIEEVGLELNFHVFINVIVEKKKTKKPKTQDHVPGAGRVLVIKVMSQVNICWHLFSCGI